MLQCYNVCGLVKQQILSSKPPSPPLPTLPPLIFVLLIISILTVMSDVLTGGWWPVKYKILINLENIKYSFCLF